MAAAEERIAVNEQRLRELAADMADRVSEERRTRERLHRLEGYVAMTKTRDEDRRKRADQHDARLLVWIQLLSAAVAFGSLCLTGALVYIATHR